jgi:Polysaccharide pyruvyl transferase
LKLLIRAGKDPFEVVSPEDSLARDTIGTNAGNLVFSHSVHRALSVEGATLDSTGLPAVVEDAARVNAEYDAFVVPLANAFRRPFAKQLEALSDIIERLTIPVVVVGVGAQTEIGYDLSSLAPIEGSVRRFVSAVLDRSASIGVRGELTYEYLTGLGYRDVEVIGCPSMFLHGPDLDVRRQVDQLDADSPIAISISPYVKVMGAVAVRNQRRYSDLVYVPQDIASLALMVRGPLAANVGKVSPVPVHVTHPMYRDRRMRFFVDPWTWFDWLSGRHFSFGTRIHGTIASLLAGTPAMLLAHDSRTLELARYHEIPHLLRSDITPDLDPAELYQRIDLDRLHRGHLGRLAAYTSFLDRNGLPHVFAPGAEGGGRAFDDRVRATDYPGPVLPPTSLRRNMRRGRMAIGRIRPGGSTGSDVDGDAGATELVDGQS